MSRCSGEEGNTEGRCEMETANDQVDLIGTTVSRYAIVDLIGSGGMGRVYRAHDGRLQRHVAIKVCNRPQGSQSDGEPQLEAEARALSRLSDPHIAAIYDFLSESERDFIVMELVAGVTLKELLVGGPLPFPEVVRLGKQMLQGLAAAHQAQLVHRDIKPANLKVTPTGELKILDFGVAQLLPTASGKTDARLLTTRSHTEFGLAGTIPYMSPEQLCGELADERSDIFSAGAVLYEMATGRQAFPQTRMAPLVDAILHQQPEAPSVVNREVPAGFDRVVARAMEKKPARRYQRASELEAALDALYVGRRASRAPFSRWLSGILA
jgi:serine/threonine protein kinase